MWVQQPWGMHFVCPCINASTRYTQMMPAYYRGNIHFRQKGKGNFTFVLIVVLFILLIIIGSTMKKER